MGINAVPQRSDIVADSVRKVWTPSPSWLEFFNSIFNALMGWKRSYTVVLTHDFGNIAAGGEETTTVGVSGARQGDLVLVTPSTLVAGLCADAIVTASDVVTVRRSNFSTGAIDPGSDDFRVVVLQQ